MGNARRLGFPLRNSVSIMLTNTRSLSSFLGPCICPLMEISWDSCGIVGQRVAVGLRLLLLSFRFGGFLVLDPRFVPGM